VGVNVGSKFHHTSFVDLRCLSDFCAVGNCISTPPPRIIFFPLLQLPLDGAKSANRWRNVNREGLVLGKL
jgi:hypothetical protein